MPKQLVLFQQNQEKSEELDQEITVKNVKNKVVINPNMREEFALDGQEVLEVSEIDEKINMRNGRCWGCRQGFL